MESSYNKVNRKFLWLSRDWTIWIPNGRVLCFDSIEQTKEHSILYSLFTHHMLLRCTLTTNVDQEQRTGAICLKSLGFILHIIVL